MSDHHEPTPVGEIADALARWAGQGALIIDHMSRWSARGSRSAGSVPTVMRGLIRETLAPLSARHAPADLQAAAAVLADAVDTLGEEILLVEPPGAA